MGARRIAEDLVPSVHDITALRGINPGRADRRRNTPAHIGGADQYIGILAVVVKKRLRPAGDVAVRHIAAAIVRGIQSVGQDELFEVVLAIGLLGGGLGFGQGRQQHRGQDGDDGNDHQ